jgi:hypothetical protein
MLYWRAYLMIFLGIAAALLTLAIGVAWLVSIVPPAAQGVVEVVK